MEKNLAKWTGKPTAYLDQNILDLLVDGRNPELRDYIVSNFQPVFSDETFIEIERSGDGAENFLLF
ncbi:hypothetical protein [uncultured Microbulbifer sp.]|uniref:hypothetical protein n=1 Tax=uncultured Microbulbifer sp. TaxID=348147 RepID=UPI00260D7BF6|nr:hypothetical protein [uncultured Microbulbifer sp.]